MSTFASQIQVCECCESEQIESKSFYTIIFGSEFNRAFYKTKVDINFHGGIFERPQCMSLLYGPGKSLCREKVTMPHADEMK